MKFDLELKQEYIVVFYQLDFRCGPCQLNYRNALKNQAKRDSDSFDNGLLMKDPP